VIGSTEELKISRAGSEQKSRIDIVIQPMRYPFRAAAILQAGDSALDLLILIATRCFSLTGRTV
jgi:hypothetical protein